MDDPMPDPKAADSKATEQPTLPKWAPRLLMVAGVLGLIAMILLVR